KSSKYLSLAYKQRLKEAGLLVSTGSTGDPYDNTMAESINGFYKAEVIHRKSWKNRGGSFATACNAAITSSSRVVSGGGNGK
ncbi:TPA: hypothetical protein ACH70C_005758, partial [Escherichia coli]